MEPNDYAFMPQDAGTSVNDKQREAMIRLLAQNAQTNNAGSKAGVVGSALGGIAQGLALSKMMNKQPGSALIGADNPTGNVARYGVGAD